MDVYADVAKEVEPKKARLAEMNAQLAVTTAALKEKQDQLKKVMDKVLTHSPNHLLTHPPNHLLTHPHNHLLTHSLRLRRCRSFVMRQ